MDKVPNPRSPAACIPAAPVWYSGQVVVKGFVQIVFRPDDMQNSQGIRPASIFSGPSRHGNAQRQFAPHGIQVRDVAEAFNRADAAHSPIAQRPPLDAGKLAIHPLLLIEANIIDAIQRRQNAFHKMRKHQIVVINERNVFPARPLPQSLAIFPHR